jgi:hypothetical protein
LHFAWLHRRAAKQDVSSHRHAGGAGGRLCGSGAEARIAHGVLARPMFSVTMKGFVETRDERERTDRFVLRVEQMESRAARRNSNVCGSR